MATELGGPNGIRGQYHWQVLSYRPTFVYWAAFWPLFLILLIWCFIEIQNN